MEVFARPDGYGSKLDSFPLNFVYDPHQASKPSVSCLKLQAFL